MKINKSMPLIILIVTTLLSWYLFFTLRSFTPFQMRLLHLALFGVWSYSLLAYLNSFKRGLNASGRNTVYLLLVFVAVFCELIQFWVPGHDPEWRGLSSSLLGVLFGIEAWRRSLKRDVQTPKI